MDALDTNRFRWKSSFSIRERLGKIPLMLDEGVESRSDGVHRIHWTRIESDKKVHFSIRERLRKIPLMLDEGVGKSFRWSPSDPLDTNRFRWKSSFSIRLRGV